MESQSTKPLLIGREEERQRIRSVITTADGPWLLFMKAGAGTGKSRLLEAMLDEFGSQEYVSSGLFDFFTAGHRTRDGILDALAHRFQVNGGPYAAARADYHTAMKAQDALSRVFAFGRMETALAEALRQRFAAARRGLIFVDTVELVAHSPVGYFFFAEFLPRLAPHVAVIAAGREIPAEAAETLRQQGAAGDTLELGGLSQAEVGQLLEARLPGQFNPADQAFVAHVHKITSGDEGGQALLVDLLAYRLNPHSRPSLGNTLSRDEVMEFDDAKLKERVVDQLMSDGSPQGQIILWLTHADHGFDQAMLRQVATPEDLETDDFAGFLDTLKPLPFVKFHPDAGVVRVHDYFRDRAREKIWPKDDPGCDYRSDLSRPLKDYFASQGATVKDEAGSPEHDRLVQYWLYHMLFADRARAYPALWQTLDEAWHDGRIDFMNDLLGMMENVDKMMPTPTARPQILRRMIQTVTAWAWQEDWDTPREAIADLANEVIGDESVPNRLRYSAMAAKGMALGDTHRGEEANEVLREALEGYDRLLAAERAAAAGDQGAQAVWDAELGLATVEGIAPERNLILNTIGYNERARGNFDKAYAAFEQSYKLSKAAGDLRWKASAANQMGTVLRYQGMIPEALGHILLGLDIRRELGVQSQIGYSLLALGQLKRDVGKLNEARAAFEEARAIFESVDARRDIATMWTELGWVETLDKEYARAESCFEKAIATAPKIRSSTLKEKYGKMLLRQAETTTDAATRTALLDRAAEMLREGVAISGNLDRQLYAALCLAALMRVAELRDDEEAMQQWADQLAVLRDKGYPFDWAYAEMEEIHWRRAAERALKPDGTVARVALYQATDHCLRMFAHLARYSPILYRDKREELSRWLHKLPGPWKQPVGRRMIKAWRAQPDKLAKRHPGLIQTVKTACELD